jgi:hypothetical protein
MRPKINSKFGKQKQISVKIPPKPMSKILELFQKYSHGSKLRDKRRKSRVDAKQQYDQKVKVHAQNQTQMKALLQKSVSKLNAKIEDFDRDFASDIS